MIFNQRSIIEKRLGKPDALAVRVCELVDPDRLPEQVTRMEEHRAERQLLPAPQHLLRIKSDVAVLVIGQRLHPLRQ